MQLLLLCSYGMEQPGLVSIEFPPAVPSERVTSPNFRPPTNHISLARLPPLQNPGSPHHFQHFLMWRSSTAFLCASLPDYHLLASSSNIKFSASFLIPLFLASKSVVSCPAFEMSHFSPKEIKSSHSVGWPSLAANIRIPAYQCMNKICGVVLYCLMLSPIKLNRTIKYLLRFMSAPVSISNLKVSR